MEETGVDKTSVMPSSHEANDGEEEEGKEVFLGVVGRHEVENAASDGEEQEEEVEAANNGRSSFDRSDISLTEES